MARLQLVEPRGEPLVRVGRDEVRLPRAFGCPSACFLGVTLTSAHALRFLPHDVTVAQRSTWAGDLRGGVFSRAGRSDASSPQQSTLASRFYQIKTGHSVRAVPQLDEEPDPPRNVGGAGTRTRLGSTSSRCVRSGRPSKRSCGQRCGRKLGGGRDRRKIRDLLADERCSRAVLDFLNSTDVGRRVPAEEDAVSEVSEAELREFLGELGAEVEEPGVGGTPLFLPTPDSMASAGTV